MKPCEQEVEGPPPSRRKFCGKPARRVSRFPWDPGCRMMCCEDCLKMYLSLGIFTQAEAEAFFPVEQAERYIAKTYVVSSGGKEGLDAAREVFGLSDEEAEYLFLPNGNLDDLELDPSPDTDASPKEVAHHIRKFCDYREKETT